jgi:hypothetical protein
MMTLKLMVSASRRRRRTEERVRGANIDGFDFVFKVYTQVRAIDIDMVSNPYR